MPKPNPAKFILLSLLALVVAVSMVPSLAGAAPFTSGNFQTTITPTVTPTPLPESETGVYFQKWFDWNREIDGLNAPLEYPLVSDYSFDINEDRAQVNNGFMYRLKCPNENDVNRNCTANDIAAKNIDKVYYLIEYNFTIITPPDIGVEVQWPGSVVKIIFSDNSFIELTDCENKIQAVTCSGQLNGSIPIQEAGRVTLYIQPNIVTLPYAISGSIHVELAFEPLDDCSANYEELETVVNNGNIDATVEFPPAVQITQGKQYKLQISGGPWSDGTNSNRFDVQYSSNNGTTWSVLGSSNANGGGANGGGLCSSLGTGANGSSVYFTAAGANFKIRVNDSPGQFIGNEGAMTYQLIAVQDNAGSCSWQYNYDPVSDLLINFDIQANNELGYQVGMVNVPAPTVEFVPGEYYVIEIDAASPWYNGDTTPRLDIAASSYAANNAWTPWAVLNPEGSTLGGDYVDCVSKYGGKVYVYWQATAYHARFRVNDVPNDFINNMGTMHIKIYAAEQFYLSQTCTGWVRGSFLASGIAQADQSKGSYIGLGVVSATSTTFNQQLVAGKTYAIETTGGPWLSTGGATTQSYDAQLTSTWTSAVGPIVWENIDVWSKADCIEQLDAAGHYRVYFTAQVSGNYAMRVAGTNWSNQSGSLGWSLYESQDASELTNCTGELYDPELASLREFQIPSTASTGILALPSLELPYGQYAIRITGGPWYEFQGASTGLYDVQISYDNGATWLDLVEGIVEANQGTGGATLCYVQDPLDNSHLIVVNYSQGEMIKIRVKSNSYADNYGYMVAYLYRSLLNNPGTWFDCFQEMNLPAQWPINNFQWIPVSLKDGLSIEALQPGSRYAIEILEGPWTDEDDNNDHYDAALSFDNGASWEELSDSARVDCFKEDILGHVKATFVVQQDDKYKLRVNDDIDGDVSEYAANGGNLAFKLYVLQNEAPDGYLGNDPYMGISIVTDVCTMMCIPAINGSIDVPLLEVSIPIPNVGGWASYAACSVQSYFAWCPYHTEAVLNIPKLFTKYEPFGTLNEITGVGKSIKTEIDSYEWIDSNAVDSAIGGEGGGDGIQAVAQDIYSLPADSPYNGGKIELLGPASYNLECNNEMRKAVGSIMAEPICFASSQFRAVGAAMWFQIILDVVVIVLLGVYIGNVWVKQGTH